MKHSYNCAIYRLGDIRAWCDCGAEPPVMNEIRANCAEKIGRGKEREAILRWLRKEQEGHPKTQYSGFVAMIAEEIEAGAHNED